MGGPGTLPDRPLPISSKELSWLHSCGQVAVHLGGLSEFASWRPRSYQVSRCRPVPPRGGGLCRSAAGVGAAPEEGLRGTDRGKGRGKGCGEAGKDVIGFLGCPSGSGAGVEASA